MAFNERLNDQIRERLAVLPDVEEKYMFGGVCYMVNGKMCVGVIGDELMCRIGAENQEEALEKPGTHNRIFTSMPMKGYVFVDEQHWSVKSDFEYWVQMCLDFNPHARSTKKRAPKEKH